MGERCPSKTTRGVTAIPAKSWDEHEARVASRPTRAVDGVGMHQRIFHVTNCMSQSGPLQSARWDRRVRLRIATISSRRQTVLWVIEGLSCTIRRLRLLSGFTRSSSTTTVYFTYVPGSNTNHSTPSCSVIQVTRSRDWPHHRSRHAQSVFSSILRHISRR